MSKPIVEVSEVIERLRCSRCRKDFRVGVQCFGVESICFCECAVWRTRMPVPVKGMEHVRDLTPADLAEMFARQHRLDEWPEDRRAALAALLVVRAPP